MDNTHLLVHGIVHVRVLGPTFSLIRTHTLAHSLTHTLTFANPGNAFSVTLAHSPDVFSQSPHPTTIKQSTTKLPNTLCLLWPSHHVRYHSNNATPQLNTPPPTTPMDTNTPPTNPWQQAESHRQQQQQQRTHLSTTIPPTSSLCETENRIFTRFHTGIHVCTRIGVILVAATLMVATPAWQLCKFHSPPLPFETYRPHPVVHAPRIDTCLLALLDDDLDVKVVSRKSV